MFLFAAAILTCMQSGREIDSAHTPAAGAYAAPSEEGQAAWTVRGKGFTLDLTARTLNGEGSNGGQQDKYNGIGLLLDGAKDVTIKNLTVSGYHQNIVLRNCENVRIFGCKVSRSRAIRMGDGGKAVDTFLNLRDVDAWRTYGAGIWIEKCKGCRIEGCTASDAQNGIALVDTSESTVFNNDCSFNGGWGIALWNSSHNSVDWNHADFCNRPWAGGWGGDAAGIVVVNGSAKNRFCTDSMTHGGDGFFLSDRTNGGFNKETQKYEIQGQCPENSIAFCDGSWSSNNAFECTFSTANQFYKNLANDSNYGFWLGFSSYSLLIQNTVLDNKSDGVALPQGVGNFLFRNDIERAGGAAVHIWSDEGAPLKAQPALGNSLISNRLANSPKAIAQERAYATEFQANTIDQAATPPKFTQKPADFAILTRLGSYAAQQNGAAAESTHAHRPPGWQFYRDTHGPKGQSALIIGDYCPRRL